MSSVITSVNGYRIWDSRGRPTLEVVVCLQDGSVGHGIAPAGASRGSHEAIELRDGGARFGGLGVDRAIQKVNGPVREALIGMDAADQAAVDARLLSLDPSPTKSVLGGNTAVATSLAVLHASAKAAGLPLWRHLSQGGPVTMPLPEVQIFGGGAHAGRRVDIQDFLVMPVGAQSFDEAMCMCAEIYRHAGLLMQERGSLAGVADEGGWWPAFTSNEDALQALTQAIERAGYGQGEALISLDIAASEFGREGRYRLALEDKVYDTDAWLEVLASWLSRYPIASIEDPVAEDDAAGMVKFTQAFGRKIQIIGDDFLVTNAQRVDQAVAAGSCNAVLVKPNQAGTVSEAHAAMQAGQRAGWGTVISARSGETEDVAITHLAVGWNAGQLKVGSFARSERMAKWNEALRIERESAGAIPFVGAAALPTHHA